MKELNITQNHFANCSGVRPNTINDMCNGKTKRIEIKTLEAILYYLNKISLVKIEVEDLIEYRVPEE